MRLIARYAKELENVFEVVTVWDDSSRKRAGSQK